MTKNSGAVERGAAADGLTGTIRRTFVVTDPAMIDTSAAWRAFAEQAGFVLHSVQFQVPFTFTAEMKE